MTRITINLPEEVVAALGGDPEAIARRLERGAADEARPTNGEGTAEKPPMSKEEFAELCEEATEGYDFNAWREFRQRSLL